VWSIHITASSPGTAYYSTFARAPELALGAALAVAAPHLGRLPGRPARRGEAGSALDESNDRGERPQAGGRLRRYARLVLRPTTRIVDAVSLPLVVNRTVTCVAQGHISRTYGFELAPEFRLAFRRQLFR
jgi:hypothetical protein